jgi:hypothetical protein
MPKISDKKMDYYRHKIRGIGQFLIDSSHSDGYIRAIIYNNRHLGDFEKALRELIKPKE